jgi:L-arabinose transport system substrate-binding protein
MRLMLIAAAGVLAAIVGLKAFTPQKPERVKIGFLVKMPEQAWFINESAAAVAAGREQDFDVVTIGTQDGEKLMTAIDNLASQGAQGFVVCPPDVRLGPAVADRAKMMGLKVVTVDDQFLGPGGNPLTEVPHLGMSGYKIGRQVGETIAAEMQRRGWNVSEVGAVQLTMNELPTGVQRVSGARDALLEAGSARPENVFAAAQRTSDTEGASTAAAAVFSQHPNIRKWVIFGLNEESVLGGVRASEQFGIEPEQVIGVGIGGSATAVAEFSKSHATGFYATVAVSSSGHGRRSALNLVEWIRHGKKPPANTETFGTVMTRSNWRQVKTELQI